jgi:hypothetical protein
MSKFTKLYRSRAFLLLFCSSFILLGSTQAISAQAASSGTIIYTNSNGPVEFSIKVTNLDSSKLPFDSSSRIKVEFSCKVKGTDLPETVSTRNGKILNLGPKWSLGCYATLKQKDEYGRPFELLYLFDSDDVYSTNINETVITQEATLKLMSTSPVVLTPYVELQEMTFERLDVGVTALQIADVVLIDGIKPSSSAKNSSSKSSKTPAPTKTKGKSSSSKVIKDGSSCSTAGKITNVSGVNLVCAKIGSKMVWVSLSDSGVKTKPTPIPTTVAPKGKSCSPDLSEVDSYIGADNSQGENLAALVFENLSECNLTVSVVASFICLDGGTLKPGNVIQSTGTFALRSKEKLLVTQVSRYFPLLPQQCFQLTGYRTNTARIDTFYGGSPRATVISSTP